MKRRLPPLAALPAFEAAARLGNFTRAAEELHVTHGAVSRAIAQLEHRLGVELFERHARRVSLTSAGQHLFKATDTAFLALEVSLEKLHEQDEAASALRLSCEPTLAMRWLMPRLGRLRCEMPELKVELHTAGGPINLQDVECDLAIRRLDFPPPSGLHITTLCPEYAGPVCHPLCWSGVLGQDLFKARWLHSRTRPQAWALWCQASRTDYRPASEQYFDHFYFTLQAALDQLGTAIGPLPLVYDDLQEQRLIAPRGMHDTGVEYVLMRRDAQRQNTHLERFVAWLQEQAAPLWDPGAVRKPLP